MFFVLCKIHEAIHARLFLHQKSQFFFLDKKVKIIRERVIEVLMYD